MKIGIIGGGNIGSAIVNGLANSTSIKNSDLYISDLSQSRLQELKDRNKGINTLLSNVELIKQTDIIILAVKPWIVESIVNEIKKHIDYKKQLIVSVAAGVDFSQLSTLFLNNKK